jgi:hypothetical protein
MTHAERLAEFVVRSPSPPGTRSDNVRVLVAFTEEL